MEFVCKHYRTGRTSVVSLSENGTTSITESGVPIDTDLILAPGFVDLQINGFKGVDFNASSQIQVGDIAQVIEEQWALGVAYLLPTVTTNSFEHIKQALRNVVEAIHDGRIGRSIRGVHLEGPYISPDDGPRGAHPREHVRPPSWGEFQAWQEAAEGNIRLVTLSPEYPEAISFTERLVESGVVAAIGHTNATPAQIREAVRAGATMSTHLGNGAHAQLQRHPNYIWEQMAADQLCAGLIVDGYHLPPAVVKCMVRSKGLKRSILVTDAVSIAGLSPGRYQTLGMDVELTEEGAVRLTGTPYLAGSALTMPEAVVNAAAFAEISLADAIDLASYNPARFMAERTGLELPLLEQGTFTVLKPKDSGLSVELTVLRNQVAYGKNN